MAWITVSEATERTGYSAVWITRLIRQGRLGAKRAGPIWLVSEASLRSFLTQDRPVGRPPKRRRKGKE